MACVNKSSKEFKQLAKDANISEVQLESLVYEYINQEGYDGMSYPSVDYINQKLEGKETLCGEQSYKLWEQQYSQPIIVNTTEELNTILEQLGKVFDKNAIGIKFTNNGKIQINVKKPTVITSVAFEEHEEIGNHRTQDENLRELLQSKYGETSISSQALVNYVRSKSNNYNTVLDILEKKGLLKDIKIQLHSSQDNTFLTRKQIKAERPLSEGRRAYYQNGVIHINANALFNDGDASSVVMHEIMHAVTVNKLAANQKLREAFEKIIQEYQEKSKRPYPEAHQYDANNIMGKVRLQNHVEEFVADIWSDPILINELKRIDSEEQGQPLKLWDKVKKFFSDLFAGELFKNIRDKSLMAKASNTIIELLDSVEGELVGGKFFEHGDYTSNFRGLPIKDGPIENGIAARFHNGTEILVDRELLRQKFEEKAWTNPRLQKDGSKADALNKNQFSTYEEFEYFTLMHEYMHSVYPRTQEMKTTGEYETFINNKALEEIAKEKKDSKVAITAQEKAEADQKFVQKVQQLRKEMNQVELANLQRDIANAMSDLITDAFQHPEKYEQLAKLSKDDIAKMSRQQMVQTLGVDNFMSQVFKAFAGNRSLKFAKTRLLLVKDGNWATFVRLAMTTFKEHEKFAIIQDGSISSIVESESINNAEEYNEDQSDSVIAETENTQEHWQIEARSLETEATLSQKVREVLNQCYLLEKDANGNLVRVKSDNAVDQRIEVKDATYQILSWTEGCFTLKEMIDRLQAQVEKNPWITQILEKLQDTSGQQADFQSQFFNNFCKSMQLYSIVRRKGKHLVSNIVNRNPANKVAMDSIVAQFNLGQHPMFTSTGKVNKTELANFTKLVEDLGVLEINAESITKISNLAASALASLGFTASQDMFVQALNKDNFKEFVKNLQAIQKNLTEQQDNENYAPFTFKSEGSIFNYVKNVVSPIALQLDAVNVNMTIDNGKMYQSRVIPSYLTKLMAKFKQENQEKFQEFIENEYGKYEWFATTDASGNLIYRNVWLDKLMRDPNARKQFEHKVQLNYNKKGYMRDLSTPEYIVSLIAEYFSETRGNNNAIVPAWFRVPMLSNKPSSEFIKFDSYRGLNYKDQLTENFFKVFEQELSRIQTCKRREEAGIVKGDKRYIKNFDKNGQKFQLLDFMQNEVDNNTELGNLIKKKIKESSEDKMSSEELERLQTLAKEKIKTALDERADKILDQWEKMGVFNKARQVEGVGVTDAVVKDSLRNFIWNDAFAATQIMELTITDPAYYKDAEDLQKRMAEIHAPGMRGNVDATDYNGKNVTDGQLRTIYIQDNEIISNIIDNISEVFDRKIAAATTEQQKKELETLKDALVGKNGAYRQVNVTDAQAYTGLTGLRKKALMLGKWNQEKEELYQKIKKGEKYDPKDVIALTQILKPFVYSQIEKSANAADVPMSKLKVPIQNKNSEYLLYMADALLSNEQTSRPNILKVLSEVMEESEKGEVDEKGHYVAGTHGIDVIQFNSTVKSGEQGVIDINDLESEEDIKETIREAVYGVDPQINKAREAIEANYDKDVVHHYPAEDYAEQQEVPEHFKEHQQIYGSQIRAIIEGDQGTGIYVMEDGRELSRAEFRAEYENTVAANVQLSIDALVKELQLDQLDSKQSNLIISRILQKEILSNPRYGVDLAIACSINPQTGKFNIPLGDPIQSKRIEQLINSIIKNRINKQTIAGGPVVQVSNFGASKNLQIRFYSKEKDGNGKQKLLLTKEEWEKSGKEGKYEDYVKENQAGVAYWEVMAPIYSDALLAFADKEGNINIKAIEKFNPKLLELIGYRIPTEDKYSMAPLKIVGFLPREAGEGIMLPSEITTITGSDFDVDKFYLMRNELPFKVNKVTLEQFYDALTEGANYTEEQKANILKSAQEFMQDPMNPKWTNKPAFTIYMSLAFKQNEIKDERVKNNNHLIEMTKAVLTHEQNSNTMLNPGGFEEQKKMGYVIQALKTNPKLKYEDLMQMSIDELKQKGYRSKNLIFVDEQVGFYQQNSAAASLIGIFAVHKSAHSIFEGDGMGIQLKALFDKFKNEKPVSFSIGSTTFGTTAEHELPIEIDPTYDSLGNLISKTVGSVLAASADAVKDPVLNLINVNQNTANILTAMLRVGVPFEEAALFLSQKPIVDLIQEVENSKLTKPRYINDIIEEKIKKYRNTKLFKESLTKEEMIKNQLNPTEESTAKALIMFQRMGRLAQVVQKVSLLSRFNSMNGGTVGPLIIDNLIMESKLANFPKTVIDNHGNELTAEQILKNHPMLEAFSQGFQIAKKLFNQMNMPLNSKQFAEIIEAFPENIQAVLLKDRSLLSKLGNFYLSYRLINNLDLEGNERKPVIDSSKLAYYKKDFIKDYVEESKKFKDNPLIQALKLTVNSETGYVDLKLDLKGLTIVEKERLTAGWAELWKGEGKELATKLFEYNFFKGGIDFNPKTIISLMPLQMHQELQGYLDVFEKDYPINAKRLVNQFLRNNSDNVKLVPIIKDYEKMTNQQKVEQLANLTMFKDAKGNLYQVNGVLENVAGEDNYGKVLDISSIQPLGTDGFMDISTEKLDKGEEREKREVKGKRIARQEMTEEEEAAILAESFGNLTGESTFEISEMDSQDVTAAMDALIYDSMQNTIEEDVASQIDPAEEYDGRFEDANQSEGTVTQQLKTMSTQAFLNSVYSLKERQAYQQMPVEMMAQQKDKILEQMKEKAAKFSGFKFDDNFFNECLDKLC